MSAFAALAGAGVVLKAVGAYAQGRQQEANLLYNKSVVEAEDRLNQASARFEMERIERAVAKYFQGIEPILKEQEVDVKEKILEAQTAFDGFGWGGPELEKRIIKRLNQQVEEALQNAESGTDPARQVIYAEIAKLLCKLQHALLAEPRPREILAQMKP